MTPRWRWGSSRGKAKARERRKQADDGGGARGLEREVTDRKVRKGSKERESGKGNWTRAKRMTEEKKSSKIENHEKKFRELSGCSARTCWPCPQRSGGHHAQRRFGPRGSSTTNIMHNVNTGRRDRHQRRRETTRERRGHARTIEGERSKARARRVRSWTRADYRREAVSCRTQQ